MSQGPVAARFRLVPKVFTGALFLALMACDDGGGRADSSADGGGDGSGGSMSQPSLNGVDEAVLVKCPQSSTLIETTEWPSCLAGKSLKGIEPFSNKPCELRIGNNGVFEYLQDNAVAIAVPDRSKWEGATGNYQNDVSAGPRFFLAGIAPDLVPVEGEPRVTNINLSLFALDTLDDKVEVVYLDAALARQTYNCTVDAL